MQFSLFKLLPSHCSPVSTILFPHNDAETTQPSESEFGSLGSQIPFTQLALLFTLHCCIISWQVSVQA